MCPMCAQVEDRGQRMQEDYRLDFGVADACEPDVTAFCAAEKVGNLSLPRELPDRSSLHVCQPCQKGMRPLVCRSGALFELRCLHALHA